MNNRQDIFIGRKDELEMIKRKIFDPTGAKHLVRMVGEGGVGKTYWFKKIDNDYKDDPELLIIRLDYAEVRNQNLAHLMWSVLRELQVDEEDKEQLSGRLAQLQQEASIDFDSEKVREKEENIYDYFVKLVSQASGERRLLILNDTVESIYSATFGRQLMEVTSLIPNAVMVFAARPQPNVRDMYRYSFEVYQKGGWVVPDVHQFQGFSNQETRDYFDESLPAEIDPTLHKKIYHLTNGRPVLVAITGEWLKRNVELPEDINRSIEKVQALDEAELTEVRAAFEKKLIENVQSLHKPIHWATLYLAYLNRRYDQQILQLALEIEEAELEPILEELKSLVFVRQSISTDGGLLHDEAQKLIEEHAWPLVDPSGELRHWLAETVITQYYEPKIKRLNKIVRAQVAQAVEQKLIAPKRRALPPIPSEDFAKWELQIECLDYHFRIDENQGWTYLNDLITEAERYYYSFIQMDAIEQAIHNLKLKEKDPMRAQMCMSRILRLKKDRRRAVRLAEAALQASPTDPTKTALALIVLGKSTTDLADKLSYYQTALEKAQEAKNRLLEAEGLKLKGLVFRRQGKWRQAATAYRQVLRLLDEQKEPNQYANTLNNLAFVTMLNGNPRLADNMAEKALRIRKEQSNLHALALSYATKGRIAEAIGHVAKAVRYHRMSVDLAQSVGDDRYAAIFQTNIGRCERLAHNFDAARQLLGAGLEHSSPRARARALHEAAKIEWDQAELLRRDKASGKKILAKYTRAKENAQQALKLAREIGDEHQEASILLDLASLAFTTEQRKDQKHLDQLQQILDDRGYTLEKGRLEELRGHFAHMEADHLAAFSHYVQACEILAGYSPPAFQDTFERVRAKYWDADLHVQREVGHLINQKFASVPDTSPLAALKDLSVDQFNNF